MTREGALLEFLSGFGMEAYPNTNVPVLAKFPYITFETTAGNWGESISITVNLWYHTESESVPNAKVREISERIGLGGVILDHEDGKIWIRRGSPWVTSLSDDLDHSFKRRQLIFIVEDWRI